MHYVKAKGLLSNNNGMNIYRGCEHGCIYCDSRSRCYNMNHAFEDIEVKINTNLDLNRVYISIKNYGYNIEFKDREKIFERFYRVDKSRCRNTGGTGVGLTICKSIVDLHKGKIEVKSKLNEGSEFIITLPN